MYNISFSYNTVFSDLDIQHHLNSNKYFDLFETGKYLLLDKIGLTKDILLDKKLNLNQYNTKFKFLNQVKDNENIDINISLKVYQNGILEWFGSIENNSKKCFEITSINKSNSNIFDDFINENKEFAGLSGLLNLETLDNKKYSNEFKLRYRDRNYFGNIPENISWKLFEETRWNQLYDLGLSSSGLGNLDVAFFWRDSEYRYSNIFEPSQELTSNVWIDKLDNIKIIFAHEILNKNKEVIANSINTIIPVSISKQRPMRIPEELIEIFGKYIKIKKFLKRTILEAEP